MAARIYTLQRTCLMARLGVSEVRQSRIATHYRTSTAAVTLVEPFLEPPINAYRLAKGVVFSKRLMVTLEGYQA